MAPDETAEIQIRRDPRDVAAYMFDPAHDPEWVSGISEAGPLTPPPMGLGSRVAELKRILEG